MSVHVDRVVLRHVRVHMREPFRISNGVVSDKESIIIELHAGHLVGYGEASPMSGSFYSAETPESTWNALANDLVPDLFARDIPNPASYADLLNDYRREPFARAGIEGAVWDLFAKHLDTTIGTMLGSTPGDVPSGLAVGIYDTVEELLERIERYLTDGYRRVKIKIKPGWDVEPLSAVRQRFGDFPLMADANTAYNLAEHGSQLRALDQFHLMMIEQPLAADAIGDMGLLAKMLETPICADESAESLAALESIIQHEAASIINIKVQRVGGLWNSIRMLDRAREVGLACWLGTMPELGIASAQALEIAFLPGFVYPTDIEESDRWFEDDIISPKITIASNGLIEFPAHGFDVDTQKLEHYTTHLEEF